MNRRSPKLRTDVKCFKDGATPRLIREEIYDSTMHECVEKELLSKPLQDSLYLLIEIERDTKALQDLIKRYGRVTPKLREYRQLIQDIGTAYELLTTI